MEFEELVLCPKLKNRLYVSSHTTSIVWVLMELCEKIS